MMGRRKSERRNERLKIIRFSSGKLDTAGRRGARESEGQWEGQKGQTEAHEQAKRDRARRQKEVLLNLRWHEPSDIR
eukprot:6022293-Pleurochrysis_carterae.AAC.9